MTWENQTPIEFAADATANDATISAYHKWVMVSGAGNINAKFKRAENYVVIPLLANVLYPFSIEIIKSSGTDATGIKVFA